MTVSVSLRCRWTSPLRAWKQSLRPAIPFPSYMQQSDWAGLDQRQHKPFRLWLRRSRLSISAGRPSRRWERSGLRHELRYLRSWHSRMKLWLAFTQRTRCPKSEAIDGPWTRARDFRLWAQLGPAAMSAPEPLLGDKETSNASSPPSQFMSTRPRRTTSVRRSSRRPSASSTPTRHGREPWCGHRHRS